jgi:hypothetical protein
LPVARQAKGRDIPIAMHIVVNKIYKITPLGGANTQGKIWKRYQLVRFYSFLAYALKTANFSKTLLTATGNSTTID